MKISVTIPVYNTKRKYLREAIGSILSQTSPVHEIVVINDGSYREETIIELSRIRGIPNVKVVDQENKNMSCAVNAGIANMDPEADWWAGCASDDRWLPHKIEKQGAFIEVHPEAKVLYCDWEFMDSYGFKLKNHIEPEFSNRLEAGRHIIREYIGNWSGMMIHRSVFEDIGLYNESFTTRSDYEMNVRILTKYMMYKVPGGSLLQYRLHDEQVTNSVNLGTRSDDSRKFCEMSRDLAIKHFGTEADRKEFPLGREYRWGK